jgi:sugar lactone lactonase YvrE
VLRNFLFFLIIIGLSIATGGYLRYGGGDRYQDLSTPPLLAEERLEQVLQYPEPIGKVAIGDDNRIFFTVHPESRPQGNKLLEWVSGAAVPYPSGSVQPHLFNTVLGITIDRQQRLWSIDHGQQGFGQPRLLAFDLGTGDLVHDHEFSNDIAPIGSFLQDVRVSPDGHFVIISDGSVLRKKPALIVYEVAKQNARRILESHESVTAEDLLIRISTEELSFFGGLISLKVGVNGIAIDPDNEWLYFAATNNSSLYRIRMQHVVDATIPENELQTLIERYSDKPLSDGLSTDLDGNIYVTDVEHNSISIVGNDRLPKTLVRSSDIRWASGLSFGPDGYLYVADSAFPELLLKTKKHIAAQGPFSIYRFDTGHAGTPGQ